MWLFIRDDFMMWFRAQGRNPAASERLEFRIAVANAIEGMLQKMSRMSASNERKNVSCFLFDLFLLLLIILVRFHRLHSLILHRACRLSPSSALCNSLLISRRTLLCKRGIPSRYTRGSERGSVLSGRVISP